MPITRSPKTVSVVREDGGGAGTPMKTIKALYVASRGDGSKSKIDLSNLAKIVDATLLSKGIVRLQTEINDTETTAATPKAVNTVKQLADANTAKITEIEQSINEALPGAGTLADKLKDVAFRTKDNQFTVNQTLLSADDGGADKAAVQLKAQRFDSTTGSFNAGANAVKTSVSLQDKACKDVAGVNLTVDDSGRKAALTVNSTDGQQHSVYVQVNKAGEAASAAAFAPATPAEATGLEIATAKFVKDQLQSVATNLVDATDAQRGLTLLSDTPDESKDAATGKTAVTPKALFDVDAKITAVAGVVGGSAENVALVNKTNTFTELQKIQADDKILNLGKDGEETEGTADDALVLGSSFDESSAEIIIAANGSITRTELPPDPDDLEIATIGYVKSLGDISSSMTAGNWTIAMSDFTDPAHQPDMEEGVFYSVPFNAQSQYIQIDPETGKPAENQAGGVTDNKVDHFVIVYKAPTSKLVMNLGERKIAPDFGDVPVMSKDNTFAGTNTFKDAQKQTSSVDPQLTDVNANSYITKSELVSYFTANAPWSNVVTVEPSAEDMVPGQIYFLVEE